MPTGRQFELPPASNLYECSLVIDGLEVENLFLQGLEHRNWLEDNKMALKFLLEGPKGRGINTRKRVGLALGLYDKDVPPLFRELRDRAVRNDRLLTIDFVRLRNRVGGKVEPRILL
mgnify:CR=1 FL=1